MRVQEVQICQSGVRVVGPDRPNIVAMTVDGFWPGLANVIGQVLHQMNLPVTRQIGLLLVMIAKDCGPGYALRVQYRSPLHDRRLRRPRRLLPVDSIRVLELKQVSRELAQGTY